MPRPKRQRRLDGFYFSVSSVALDKLTTCSIINPIGIIDFID